MQGYPPPPPPPAPPARRSSAGPAAGVVGALLVVFGTCAYKVADSKHTNACIYGSTHTDPTLLYFTVEGGKDRWLGIPEPAQKANFSDEEFKRFWLGKFETDAKSEKDSKGWLEAITMTYEMDMRAAIRSCAAEYDKGVDILDRASALAHAGNTSALEGSWAEWQAHLERVRGYHDRVEASCH
jgi:hypothetical protein